MLVVQAQDVLKEEVSCPLKARGHLRLALGRINVAGDHQDVTKKVEKLLAFNLPEESLPRGGTCPSPRGEQLGVLMSRAPLQQTLLDCRRSPALRAFDLTNSHSDATRAASTGLVRAGCLVARCPPVGHLTPSSSPMRKSDAGLERIKLS